MMHRKPQPRINRFPFAHTFSIIAHDATTGEMGIAVQSHWFSVGSVVCYAQSGVGVVATQSIMQPRYGVEGLALMARGNSPAAALDQIRQSDPGSQSRQVAMLNADGKVASFTGDRCIVHAGHILDPNHHFSVQANLMKNNEVWPAMAEAYRESSGPLSERLLLALEAGQQAGGDIRGKQSAAMLIVKIDATGKPWVGGDRVLDLRVDDHSQPIEELKRLVKIDRGYHFLNQGEEHEAQGDIVRAIACYQQAIEKYPENIEFHFWYAVMLAENGKTAESLPIFKQVFQADHNWAALLKNLHTSQQFKSEPETLRSILAQAAV